MRKVDIVREMIRVLGTREAANHAVNTVLNEIKAALRRKERVTINNFGVFRVSDRPARQGRNPVTGAAVAVPARSHVRFKPSRSILKG